MEVKDNLRKVRKAAHFSQEKLAEEMSVSRQTISKWETGESYPSTKHIFKLTKVLNCALDELMGEKTHQKIFTPQTPHGQPNTITVTRKRRFLKINTIAIACVLTLCLVLFAISKLNNLSINDSKLAVFDKITEGFLDTTITADEYTNKKLVGYGISSENGAFYIKCTLYGGTGSPCSAIVYFCEKDGAYSYECQYYDDLNYRPDGEYYEIG